MSPVRFIVLAVLFYLLYRLLFGRKKDNLPPKPEVHKVESPAQDVLVQDPVCKTYVPKGQALREKKDGETYYFCSEKCRKRFLDQD